MAKGDWVKVTDTPEGVTRLEIAIAVIADKLGIPEDSVTAKTQLGDKWDEIGMVVAFKTGVPVVSSEDMSADDIIRQVR